MDEYYVIYGDILFLINFVTDFLCLYVSGMLCSAKVRTLRVALGGALGGAYSVFMLYLSELPVPIAALLHISAAVLMVLISFGKTKIFVRTTVFAVTSALCGGIISLVFSFTGNGYVLKSGIYAEISPVLLVISAATSVFACYIYGVICRKKLSCIRANAEITVGGRKYSAKLLVDSGCYVVDPITGEMAVIVSKSVFGDDNIKAVRFIPYKTASGTGILYGFTPESLKINGKTVSAVIAVNENQNTYFDYQGLVPPILVK